MDIFKPIQIFADLITYDLFNITNKYWGDAINFFIYDVIKIGLLLVVINYIMAITRYYFPIEKVRDILTKRNWYGLDYLLAALLGLVTPFCSCSSIPLFIGFVGAGIPLGVTFAFLIASPLVNEASLFIFPSIFGIKMAVTYNILGLIISVLAGMVIQKLKMDKHVNPAFLKFKTKQEAIKDNKGQSVPLKKRLAIWWKDAIHISKDIFPYVVLGVGLGAIIHGFVPRDFVETYLSVNHWWTVPLATIMGLPLYANSVSVIPVIEALTNKGVPLGTALAFMTGTVTLSIPGLLILKKAMNWKLLTAFVVVTTIGIMIIGYFFNAFSFIKEPELKEVNANVNINVVIAEKDLPVDRIEVIHFHGTHQCFSCITVGKLSLQTIKEKFPEEYKTGKIVFRDINSDLEENKEIAEKYKAVGSALFFNNIKNKQDNFEEDAEVWRLVTNEEKYLAYFEEKLKTLINNI